MGRFHRHPGDPAPGHESAYGHEREHAHGHEREHAHGHAAQGGDEGGAASAHRPAGVGDHSGYESGGARVEVLERILGENDRTAAANRRDFDAAGVAVVNLMSSPGAGKTTLLERTLDHLAGRLRIGVVEGDIETSLDADRLAGRGAAVSLLNTSRGFGGECHLDATMVRAALAGLSLDDLDLLVVENVGNLVCPAEFAIGEDARAMVFSLTEGEDKPCKYPVMFRAVELVVLNKCDLLPHLDVDVDRFRRHLADVNPTARVIEVSARTGEGVDAWCDWLVEVTHRRDRRAGSGPR